jgi:hypothetical protein
MILFFFFFFFFFFLIFNLSQGFINKSTYKPQNTHSSIQIPYLTDPMLMCLWKSIQTSDVSQIQQTSQEIQISNNM